MDDNTRSIGLSFDGPLATLTLDRPAALNALNPAMLDEFLAALEAVATRERCRALLLTGAGRAFCSGMDLGPELVPGEVDAGAILDSHFNPLIDKLASLPMPVVSAVNGAAAGAGCAIALAADIVLASERAFFLMAFVNIGLVPDSGASWVLPRLVGKARASEMMMLGERVPAATALEWGMINRLCAADALADEARTLASRLADGPTRALALIRRQIADGLNAALGDTLAQERRHQRLAGESRDFVEGVAAFREKRPVQFEGR